MMPSSPEHFGFPLETILIYIGVIAFSIVLDMHAYRHGKTMSVKAATLWSFFWVGMAMLFYLYLRIRFEPRWADLFLVGFVLEESLSVDNLMVFMVIFASFNIKGMLQRRILFFGILGAIGFRILFATIGTALFAYSPWVGMVFAVIVAWTAWKMLVAGDGDAELEDYSHHWSVRMTEKVFPVHPRLVGDHFFVTAETFRQEGEVPPETVQNGNRFATPAFLCLIAIQMTDVMFSFDSVPAVIAVTQEPLLIYGAMIFAVLGLRALYYVLATLMTYLVHLGKAVIVLLFYIAFKLAVQAANEIFHWPGLHIQPTQSLMIVLGILGVGIVASLIFPGKKEAME